MAVLTGKTIRLYDKVQTGTDALNAPVYTQTPVTVDNVLICPVSTDDIITETQPQGKRAAYELCIPKGDTHIWEDREVEFYGQKWKTVGFVLQWDEKLTPGPWNRKVKVERYG